jgi:uncharacterized phiE125 gp8 family phage protein
MATGDLTTLDAAKAWLAIGSSNDDGLLASLVSAASQFIQTWLNRSIASQAYTEVRNGLGMTKMAFADYPVTAVTSVTVDGVAIPASTGPTVNGYVTDGTMLYLRGYTFTSGIQNVSLAYVAGFAVTPPEVAQACIELVAMRYRERDRIGLASKAVGGETTAYSLKDLPADVETILKNYKKVILL